LAPISASPDEESDIKPDIIPEFAYNVDNKIYAIIK
jgi:hypothetical protein